jgi:hypothetical protein
VKKIRVRSSTWVTLGIFLVGSQAGSGRWSRKVPVARLTRSPSAVADRGFAVGHLLGHPDDLAPDPEGDVEDGRAHGLGLHLEGPPGPGLCRGGRH